MAEHEKQSGEGHGRGHKGHAKGGHGGGSHEEHEGAPEWLISFADNVMLQMGFFVILLALAMKTATAGSSGPGSEAGGGIPGMPSDEQLDLAIAVREAFNNPIDVGSKDPRDWLLVQRLRTRMRGPADARRDGLEGTEHDVQSIRKTGVYGDGGFIPFAAGATELGEEGRAAAAQLAQQFRGFQTVLDVRGHCSAAEAYGQEDRGMRLTHERAAAVARELVAQGLDWKQLRITACADNERITSTTYQDEGQRTNQRVEVVEVSSSTP